MKDGATALKLGTFSSLFAKQKYLFIHLLPLAFYDDECLIRLQFSSDFLT
jgi:hypothetical protein